MKLRFPVSFNSHWTKKLIDFSAYDFLPAFSFCVFGFYIFESLGKTIIPIKVKFYIICGKKYVTYLYIVIIHHSDGKFNNFYLYIESISLHKKLIFSLYVLTNVVLFPSWFFACKGCFVAKNAALHSHGQGFLLTY